MRRGTEVIVREVDRGYAGGGRSAAQFPMLTMLTKTNYAEWCLVMQVNMEAHRLWRAIDPGDADYHTDRNALAALLRSMPLEMHATLAVMATAKLAWEAVRTQCLGIDRV